MQQVSCAADQLEKGADECCGCLTEGPARSDKLGLVGSGQCHPLQEWTTRDSSNQDSAHRSADEAG